MMRRLAHPGRITGKSGCLRRMLSSLERAKITRQYSESRSFTVREMLLHDPQKALTVPSDCPLNKAARTMVIEEVGSLMVTGESGRLVGIMTERDYLRAAGGRNAEKAASLRVEDVMSPDVVTVTADTALSACVSLMAKYPFRHLPVVDGTDLIGMIGS